MVDREQVAQFLRLNGIKIDAPADEIKSILLSAKWHKDDVETALTVLRQDSQTHKEEVDTIHKFFRSDDKLKPETISSLLGLEVNISPTDIELRRKRARGQLTVDVVVHILLISIVISSFFILVSMWLFEIGIFHQTVAGY